METFTTVIFSVHEGQEPQLEVTLQAFDQARIIVYAGSFEEAEELYKQGKEDALTLFKRAEVRAEVFAQIQRAEQKIVPMPGSNTGSSSRGTRLISGKTVERMAADRMEYEATPQGQRFMHAIETAHRFVDKHHFHGLGLSEILYLANKYEGCFINGSFDLTALVFRRGYNQGYADAKRKDKKC